jgi:hypothetical protein
MQTPAMKQRLANCSVSVTAGARMGAVAARQCAVAITVFAACFVFIFESEAVVTDLGNVAQSQHQIRIRVGAEESGVDIVNFGTIAGERVGNGQAVSAQTAGVPLSVQAWTPGDTERIVTVTADSSAGMSCITPVSCGNITIPFDTVSWSVGGTQKSGGDGVNGAGLRSGTFSASAVQPIARFSSDTRLQSTLFFRYANVTVYPAGRYSGRVTFTASMP